MKTQQIKNIKELIDTANSLYNQNADLKNWLATFQPVELAKLWHQTCEITKVNPFGAVYDDEVYNALNGLRYFN